jgi:hypothetical protein
MLTWWSGSYRLSADAQKRAIFYQVWVELRGSGQDGKIVRACVSKREMRHTLAALPVQTEQTSEASDEEKPSETGRRWVAPPRRAGA